MIKKIKDKEKIKKRKQLKEELQKWKSKKIKNKMIHLNQTLILMKRKYKAIKKIKIKKRTNKISNKQKNKNKKKNYK